MAETKLDMEDICTIIRAFEDYNRQKRKAVIKCLSVERNLAKEFVESDLQKQTSIIKSFKEMMDFCSPLDSVENCALPIALALKNALEQQTNTPDNHVAIYRYDHKCITTTFNKVYPFDSFGCDSNMVVSHGEEKLLKYIAYSYER